MEMMPTKITQDEFKKFIEVDGYRPISWRRIPFSNHVLVYLKSPQGNVFKATVICNTPEAQQRVINDLRLYKSKTSMWF